MRVDDRTGRVLEAWTGVQAQWAMARGYPGFFGRAANTPWIWVGLSALFVLPFLRGPPRMLHLDLAVLLAFALSYAAFNDAELGISVPTVYPLLAYLLARMLWVAWHPPLGAGAARDPGIPDGRADVPDRRPDRAQHHRERDRRRLRERRRRRPAGRRRAAVRRLCVPDRARGHLRAGGVRGVCAVRAGLPVERELGRPAGGPRRRDRVRPRLHRAALAARRRARRVPVGGVSVHAARDGERRQRRARAAVRARGAARLRAPGGARRGSCPGGPDEARAAGAGAPAALQTAGGGGRIRDHRCARARAVRPRHAVRPHGRLPGRSRVAVLALGRCRRPPAGGPARGGCARRRRGVRPAPARHGDGGRARRGRADRGTARRRPLVLLLPRVVRAAGLARAAQGAGAGRSTDSIASARPGCELRISTAFSHGSSSAAS